MNTLMTNLLAGLLAAVGVVPAAGPSEAASGGSPQPPATELSVAPLDHVTYPDSRPDWITAAGDASAAEALLDDQRVVVRSGLCDTRAQAQDRLSVAARVAVEQRIVDWGDFRCDPGAVTFSDEEIDQMITRRYFGTAEQGGLTMHEGAAELTFHPAIRQRIGETARNAEVGRRLSRVGGLLSVAVIGLLGSTVVVSGLSKRQRRTDRSAKGETHPS